MATHLHQYQRGVLLAFFLSLVIFVVYISLTAGKLSPTVEQTVGVTWLIAYSIFCLILRQRIADKQRVNGLQRPIMHWVLLGISVVYFNVVRPNDFQFLYPIIDLGFVIFALFSADAHWDFRKQL